LGSICTIAKKIRKIANLVKMGDTVSVEISKVDISIFSNSNNIKRLADLSDTIIKDGHPKTILGKLSHIWRDFRRDVDSRYLYYCNSCHT
jgi:hypothetical protein